MDEVDQEAIKRLESIREKRRIKNKQRRLRKQKSQLLLQNTQEIQNFGGHLHLISNPQFPSKSKACREFDFSDPSQFPAVQDAAMLKQTFNDCRDERFTPDSPEPATSRTKSNTPYSRNIEDFIVKNGNQNDSTVISGKVQTYTGNPLDADKPARYSGKFRETPVEKKVSGIKRGILIDNEIRKERGPNVTLINHIPYKMTNELELKLNELLKELVKLQRNMFAKNKVKAQIRKRYVLGFNESTKNILGNRVKLLIIAADHKIIREEDTLLAQIQKIQDIAAERNVEVIYAFTKRKLGSITKTFCLISCVAILNVDGIHNQLHAIIRDYNDIKEQTKTS